MWRRADRTRTLSEAVPAGAFASLPVRRALGRGIGGAVERLFLFRCCRPNPTERPVFSSAQLLDAWHVVHGKNKSMIAQHIRK